MTSIIRHSGLIDSRSLDASGVTARFCIVSVQIADLRLCEKSLNGGVQFAPVAHVALDHPVIEVECSDRNKTPPKNLRDLVDGVICFFRAIEHEDRVARAIGVRGGLVNAALTTHLRREFPRATVVTSHRADSPELDAWIQAFEEHIAGTANRSIWRPKITASH